MEPTSTLAKVMRFLPLFSTILMLIFWVYNYNYPESA